MKINLRQLKKWIAALDSGNFKQTRQSLNNKKGYCCLGVACEVLILDKKIQRDDNGFIDGSFPIDQPAAPKWLKDINDHFGDVVSDSLSELNDDKKLKFSEIATMLELVYIYKAFT